MRKATSRGIRHFRIKTKIFIWKAVLVLGGAWNKMTRNGIEEGDEVTIDYSPDASFRNGRSDISGTVIEVTGDIIYVDVGFDDLTLVMGPDDFLWARDEDGKDGLFGSNARVVN